MQQMFYGCYTRYYLSNLKSRLSMSLHRLAKNLVSVLKNNNNHEFYG